LKLMLFPFKNAEQTWEAAADAREKARGYLSSHSSPEH